MRKTAGALVLLAALGGCVSVDRGTPPATGPYGARNGPPVVPHVQGPYGTPVPMAHPYAANPPSAWRAYAMMSQNIPLSMVQMHNPTPPGSVMQTAAAAAPSAASGIVQTSASCPPGGCPPNFMVPPGGMISPPGMPFAPGLPPGGPMVPFGTGVPGMGVTPVAAQHPAGAVAAVGALSGNGQPRFPTQRTQVRFLRPTGMRVYWYTRTPDGRDSYSPTPIETPGRYNFLQAAVYRLKLTSIPGQPGLEVYPTLEVWPANHHTEAFLAHSSVPVTFTDEDFRQVVAGNYLVKVIYLPHPQFQDLAIGGPGQIVSTELEPGADPIEEAKRRGTILLVIRMGNMDQEAPNTPPINAPAPGTAVPHPGMIPPGMHGMMVPYGALPPGLVRPPAMMPPGTMPPGTTPPNGKPDAKKNGAPPAPPGLPPGLVPNGPVSQITDPRLQRTAVQQPAAQQAARTAGSSPAAAPSGRPFLWPFAASTGASGQANDPNCKQ